MTVTSFEVWFRAATAAAPRVRDVLLDPTSWFTHPSASDADRALQTLRVRVPNVDELFPEGVLRGEAAAVLAGRLPGRIVADYLAKTMNTRVGFTVERVHGPQPKQLRLRLVKPADPPPTPAASPERRRSDASIAWAARRVLDDRASWWNKDSWRPGGQVEDALTTLRLRQPAIFEVFSEAVVRAAASTPPAGGCRFCVLRADSGSKLHGMAANYVRLSVSTEANIALMGEPCLEDAERLIEGASRRVHAKMYDPEKDQVPEGTWRGPCWQDVVDEQGRREVVEVPCPDESPSVVDVPNEGSAPKNGGPAAVRQRPEVTTRASAATAPYVPTEPPHRPIRVALTDDNRKSVERLKINPANVPWAVRSR